MRISDWSSDGFASDLSARPSAQIAIVRDTERTAVNRSAARVGVGARQHEGTEIGLHQFGGARQVRRDCRRVAKACQCTITDADGGLRSVQRQLIARDDIAVACELHACGADRAQTVVHRDGPRSEEHTSELQSLMRISYAVF